MLEAVQKQVASNVTSSWEKQAQFLYLHITDIKIYITDYEIVYYCSYYTTDSSYHLSRLKQALSLWF